MKTIFIPGYDEQYSINENGEVWRHYVTKDNKRYYKNRLVKVHPSPYLNATPRVYLSDGNNKYTYLSLRPFMVEIFGLTPPDNYHHYKLVPKDKDPLNNSILNLEWRIITKTMTYYPQPFYNKEGKITQKICGKCGVKKDIISFDKQKDNTYHHACNSCVHQSKMIDPVKYKKLRARRNKLRSAPKAKLYDKLYQQKQRAVLADMYVKSSITTNSDLRASDITPLLMELQLKKLTLVRQLKTKKHGK